MLATYGRAEVARKDIFRHVHVQGAPHRQLFSDIAAVTLGGVHGLCSFGLGRIGRLGIGGDITLYRMSVELQGIVRRLEVRSRVPPLAAARRGVGTRALKMISARAACLKESPPRSDVAKRVRCHLLRTKDTVEAQTRSFRASESLGCW
jgi:hypothetical protein